MIKQFVARGYDQKQLRNSMNDILSTEQEEYLFSSSIFTIFIDFSGIFNNFLLQRI